MLKRAVPLALATGAIVAAAPPVAHLAQLAAFRPAGAPRATGYVPNWKFNGNDGTPIVTIRVSRSGTFAFSYRPSYCGSGGFHITGRFSKAPFRNVPFEAEFAGMKGYLVTFAAVGACQGRQASAGNTFTWTGARGLATGFVDNGKWPDSRNVMGIMTQWARTAGASGALSIDWSMSAVY